MIDVAALQGLAPTVALLAVPFVAGGIAYAVGSAIGLPPERCLFLALVVFAAALLVVLGVFLLKWVRRKLKAGRLEEGLATGTGRYDQKGEIEALRKSWKESAAKLKGTAVGGGGSRALAVLPWYVIIGAPASGKSTLLRQSGIDFPVGDAAIKGLQGTRNCDWWFSNVGVFLDTAGRYMSDEHADEWAQFLDLVRRHRTAAPINGVIVAVPAQDLLERSDAEQDLEARRIRARLDELIDHLGVNFPVWVVLTKVDLVGGFVEFFGASDAALRQQMMGWTVDQDEGARFDASTFDRRWAGMIHGLREVRPVMVAAAKLRDRPAAYGFPDEMAVLAEPLARMMQRLFEPNVYQETPLYRGLYITSATQQGTPLQRAASRVRALLGAPAVDADAQGVLIKNAYFVKDLMRERIVADHGMTWTTQHEIDRGKLKRVGINLIGSSVGVFGFLAVLAAGTCARRDLEAVAASLKESRTSDTSVVARCDELHAQQEKATFGVSKNLGLSLPLPLKRELSDRERAIYRKEIVDAMLAAHVAAIEAAPTKGAAGVAPLIAAYRDYQATASALRAIAERLKTPKAEKPTDAKPKEGAAPSDPNQPPSDLLTTDQLSALLARHDDLVARGILPKKGAETPTREIERLLAVAWRNGGIDDQASAAMTKAEEALDRGLAEHFRQVGEALRSRKTQAQEKRDSLARRKASFLAECANAERLLQGVNLAEGALRKELEIVSASVAADAAAPGAPAVPGGAVDLSVLGAVGPSLKALADAKVRTDEQLASIAGYREAKAYADAEAAQAKTPAAPSGDDAERLLTSLESISKALDEVLREGPSSAAERRPWQSAFTASDAVHALETAFKAKQDPWAASVAGQLRPLVDPAAATDELLRRHAVVRLGEALRIERMLREFVEDPSGFDAFCKKIETRKRTLPGVAELEGDLVQLAAPFALAANYPLVSAEVVSSIEDRAKRSFKNVAEAAQKQWDDKIRADTADTGDWRACLDAWADADAERGPAKLAASLDEKWGPARESRFDDAAKSDAKSAEIWHDAVDGFRAKYRAFASGVGVARKGAEALRQCVNKEITDLSLPELATKLGRSGNEPAWRQSGVLRAIPSGPPFADVSAALKSALAAGEDDLVQRIAAWFNNKWSIERERVEAAIKSPSPETQTAAREALERMRAPLTAFFGAGMSDVPGMRLSVSGEYVGRIAEISGKFAAPVSEQVSVSLECELVPSSQSDKGFPQVEIEFKELGKSPASERWLPGESKKLSFTFTPDKGEYFVIRMRNERTNAVKEFAKWTTPDCVVAALAQALGTTSDTLDWEGSGEFRGDHAKFRLVSANSERIRALASGAKTDPGARMPEKCVEIRK
jgi:hypothetical protein